MICSDTSTQKKENEIYGYFRYRREFYSPNVRTDKKGVLTAGLSEYQISKQKLRLPKDETAKYDGSTRFGVFIMVAWICTSVTDAPEVL